MEISLIIPASEGAKALAEALKGQCCPQSALQKLHLGENNISDASAKALAEALKVNTALQELHLDCAKHWRRRCPAPHCGNSQQIALEPMLAWTESLVRLLFPATEGLDAALEPACILGALCAHRLLNKFRKGPFRYPCTQITSIGMQTQESVCRHAAQLSGHLRHAHATASTRILRRTSSIPGL